MVEPADIRYFPNFLSEQEERRLLERIYGAPKPKWRQLSNRRLQNWGGLVAGNQCLIQDEPLPGWLEDCIDKIMAVPGGSFQLDRRPNHVLINEYLSGQGIMPHTDGPAFFPLISTISLGSHTLLDFYDEQQKEEEEENGQRQEGENNQQRMRRAFVGSVLLERRSLVLICGRAYDLLHAIEERKSDKIDDIGPLINRDQLGVPPPSADGGIQALERDTRVSLTIRNVPKVKRPLRCFPGSFGAR